MQSSWTLSEQFELIGSEHIGTSIDGILKFSLWIRLKFCHQIFLGPLITKAPMLQSRLKCRFCDFLLAKMIDYVFQMTHQLIHIITNSMQQEYNEIFAHSKINPYEFWTILTKLNGFGNIVFFSFSNTLNSIRQWSFEVFSGMFQVETTHLWIRFIETDFHLKMGKQYCWYHSRNKVKSLPLILMYVITEVKYVIKFWSNKILYKSLYCKSYQMKFTSDGMVHTIGSHK